MYYMSYCYPNLIDTDTHTDTDTTILIPETGIGTGLILILMPGILLIMYQVLVSVTILPISIPG